MNIFVSLLLLFFAFLIPCSAAPDAEKKPAAKAPAKVPEKKPDAKVPKKQKGPEKKLSYTPSGAALQNLGGELMSLEKEDFIRNLIASYINMGADIMTKEVEQAIMSDVSANMPFAPKTRMDGRNRAELMDAAKKAVLPRFPKTVPQFRADLAKKLEEKYKMYRIGDEAVVRYVRGPRRFIVKGTFQSFNGHTAKIGGKKVTYFDIIPEDKIKINRQYRDQLFFGELEAAVGIYRDQRSDAIYRALYDLSRKQYISNHKAGFIHYADSWMTARDLAKHLIERERFRKSALAAIALQEKAAKEKANAFELLIDKPKEADVLAKIEKEQTRMKSGSYSGIDLEQGQGNAFWGFTRGETRLAVKLTGKVFLFSREFYDYYFGKDRQIREIRLDYTNGKFCRVVSTYGDVRNLQDFKRIRAYYTKLFGPDDFARAGKPVPAGEIRSLTWTGSCTKATLEVKYNEDDEMIEQINFIKEDLSNPYKMSEAEKKMLDSQPKITRKKKAKKGSKKNPSTVKK